MGPEIIVPVMIFSIPIVAIVSSYFYKMQKLKYENGGSNLKLQEMEAKLKKVSSENEDLKQRLTNIETIVTDAHYGVLLPKNENELLNQKLNDLTFRLKELEKNK